MDADEEYEDWVHEQTMDAEFNELDHHINNNRKIAQNVRDKKLIKIKEDEKQKEMYMQKAKEMEAARQLKIQKGKEQKLQDNARIMMNKSTNLNEPPTTSQPTKEVTTDNWEDLY